MHVYICHAGVPPDSSTFLDEAAICKNSERVLFDEGLYLSMVSLRCVDRSTREVVRAQNVPPAIPKSTGLTSGRLFSFNHKVLCGLRFSCAG